MSFSPSPHSLFRFTLAAVLAILLCVGTPAVGQAYTSLYDFGLLPDGQSPSGALVVDASGNLYGTTSIGGAHGFGTVFQLATPTTPGGPWLESILYSFTGGADGAKPRGLAIDKGGNLYGTTASGGATGNCVGGCGTVFKLKAPAAAGGTWDYRILHRFAGGTADGSNPIGALVVDSRGVVYGVTRYGGAYSESETDRAGVVFRVQSRGSGFAETVLYNFGALGDGASPLWGVMLDGLGNAYGTTGYGGTADAGIVFKLSPQAPGEPWAETILYSFSGQESASSELILDKSGNLFGTKEADGVYGGSVWRLSPPASGQTAWRYQDMFVMPGVADGAHPSGLFLDRATSTFYGTTQYSNYLSTGCGVVYQLTQPAVAGDSWTYKVLYAFTGDEDACYPRFALTRDASGTYYGVTKNYDVDGDDFGTVFQVTPK